MSQALVALALVLTAVSAQAQQTATVTIDFPGAAAVEAGMNDPKPVDPDPQGRRRAMIAVPLNDKGTIYTMTRGDGTVVVRLVSTGQPAPAGFKSVGSYSAGQQLTIDTKTLTVSQGPTAGSTGGMADARGTNRWRGGARFGLGFGSYGDAIDDNCDELTGDINLTCEGDNGGATWYVAGDFGAVITDQFDLGVRASLTRLPEISFEAGGTFQGIDILGRAEGSGYLWTIGGEAGFRPTPRFRIFGGAGVSPFTFDSTLTLSALGESETESQENSGLGRSLWGGVDWALSDRWSLFGEVHRTSLKDDDVDADEEPFDESFTGVFFGLRFSFGR